MPIIRTKTDAEFFVMHNATAQDETLSWEARGMLAYLLSKPEGWKTNMTDLARRSPAGRDKCYRIMDELLSAGYVERIERRTDGKKAGFDYFVYDLPRVVKPTQNEADLSYLPDTVLPDTVLPDTENTDAYKEQNLERTDFKKEQKESLCAPKSAPFVYPAKFEEFWKSIIGSYHKTPLGNKREAFAEWGKHASGIHETALASAWLAYLAECRRTDTSTKHVCRWIKYHGWEQDYTLPMSGADKVFAALKEKWRREENDGDERGNSDDCDRTVAGELLPPP